MIDLTDPLSSYTCTDPEDVTTCAQLLGMSVPLALSIGFAVIGIVLMVIWMVRAPAFFRRSLKTFEPVDETPAAQLPAG